MATQYQLICISVIVLASCSMSVPPGTTISAENKPLKPIAAEIKLANGDFESWQTNPACPDNWNCSQHTVSAPYHVAQDVLLFTHGKTSVSIERREPGDWLKIAQTFDARNMRGNTIRFSAMVKRDNVTGAGGLAYVSQVGGLLGGTDQVETSYKSGTNDWQLEIITIKVSDTAAAINVSFALEGSGKLWVDDAKLEVIIAP